LSDCRRFPFPAFEINRSLQLFVAGQTDGVASPVEGLFELAELPVAVTASAGLGTRQSPWCAGLLINLIADVAISHFGSILAMPALVAEISSVFILDPLFLRKIDAAG
jgi:hypothetical protein